jgi:tRNA(Ile)-lysidine synthase
VKRVGNPEFAQRVLGFVRRKRLTSAGERIAIAVSGGADSVALLRVMLELRAELGIVLSVAHFDHQLRGDASRADAEFVRDLVNSHQLEFHLASGDTRERAAKMRETLEEAARELRYQFFQELISGGIVDKLATAHTMNDQAETVLLRMIRGAGTRGMGGIRAARDKFIRPLRDCKREEIVEYLNAIGQPWREDESNQLLTHSRNRVRHELLPLLARDYNPNIVETLARTADIAQAEEDHWQAETARLLPLVSSPGKPVRGGGRAVSTAVGQAGLSLSLDALSKQPLALQRHLVRAIANQLGITADAAHIESVLELPRSKAKGCELPGGWQVKCTPRELQFERTASQQNSADYSYPLLLPGEVSVPELQGSVHASVMRADARYNSAQPAAIVLHGPTAVVRNWQAGDRYHPAHARSEKKVKELLHELGIPQPERASWPVVVAGEQLLWVKGTRQRPVMLLDGNERLAIEFKFLQAAKDEHGEQD